MNFVLPPLVEMIEVEKEMYISFQYSYQIAVVLRRAL